MPPDIFKALVKGMVKSTYVSLEHQVHRIQQGEEEARRIREEKARAQDLKNHISARWFAGLLTFIFVMMCIGPGLLILLPLALLA